MIRYLSSFAQFLFFVCLTFPLFCNETHFSENIVHCSEDRTNLDAAEHVLPAGWLPPVVMDCGALFFDPGGPDADFQPGESQLVTFCPDDPNDFIVVDFSEFDMGPCCSARLELFEGETLGNLIRVFNSNSPAKLASGFQPGCLTFNFTADLNCPTCIWLGSRSILFFLPASI